MTMTFAADIVAPRSIAITAFKASARLWLTVAVIGQWALLYEIVAFYGASTLSRNFSRSARMPCRRRSSPSVA